MSGRLEGKAVMITGAAQGIGAAYARACAAEGAAITIVDLTRIDQAASVQADIEALGAALDRDQGRRHRRRRRWPTSRKRPSTTFGRVDVPGEQRRAHVRPAHRHVGRLPRGQLHGRDQRVERGRPVLLGAAQRFDRQHLVDRGVPAVAAGRCSRLPDDAPPPTIVPEGYGMTKWMLIRQTRVDGAAAR